MKWTIFVLTVFVLIFVGWNVSLRKERSVNISNLTASRDSIKRYEIKIGELRSQVQEKTAIIASQDAAIQSGIIERERLRVLHLKDVLTNTTLSGTIKILRDSLKLPPQIEFITVKDTTGLTKSYAKIPFTLLDLKENDISLSAGMRENKTAWFNLSVPFSGELTIGYKKDGPFKTKPVGIFASVNQYIRIDNMNSIIIKEEKKWYQKTWFHLCLGAGIMEVINLSLNKR